MKEKIDFEFPNSFQDLIDHPYYNDQTGEKFELFMLHFYKLKGYDVRHVGTRDGKTSDGGIDILVEKQVGGEVQKIGVEMKHYKTSTVLLSHVCKMLIAPERYKLTEPLRLVTTGKISDEAKKVIEEHGISVMQKAEIESCISFIQGIWQCEMEWFNESRIKFVSDPLIPELKKLRKELAKEEKQQWNVGYIFSNAVIDEIAQSRPDTLEKIKEIKGIGKIKADKYGQKIISIVKKYKR